MKNKLSIALLLLIGSIIVFPLGLACKNKYTVNVKQPNQIEPPTICSVSVTAANKNQIIWVQAANENIRYFNIYREPSDNSGWIFLSKVLYPTSFLYTDATSFPNVRSYQYRVSAVDQCGNEFFNPAIDKTIKLSIEEMVNQSYMLKWNSYEGFDVTGYKMYRGASQNTLALIDSTSATATSYIDIDNTIQNVFYQVEAIGKPTDSLIVNKTGLGNFKSLSNIASTKSVLITTDSLNALNIYLYPNPMITNSEVIFPYDATQNYQLSIFDLSGSVVYTKPVSSGEIEIERGKLNAGVYILQIAGKKIFRKKLMVGSYKL